MVGTAAAPFVNAPALAPRVLLLVVDAAAGPLLPPAACGATLGCSVAGAGAAGLTAAGVTLASLGCCAALAVGAWPLLAAVSNLCGLTAALAGAASLIGGGGGGAADSK